MIDFNKRLDEILRDFATRVESIPRGKTYGWSDEKSAITQLFRDMIKEAKPKIGTSNSAVVLSRADFSKSAIDQYESNLLEMIGEKR